jgi:hypothetical protein
MQTMGVIAQLRTTDLNESTPWGTREMALRDNQGHTSYFGETLRRAA